MDPLNLSASGAVAALVCAIVVGVYHKFIAAPASPAPAAMPATGHPVLDLIGSAITDFLKQLGTGAISNGARSVVIPFLIQALQQLQAAQAPASAPTLPPVPAK